MWGLLFCERVGASFVLNEDGRRRAVRSAFLSAVTLCLSVAHADAQSLTEDEIRIQQEALIWTTEYEGLIDGKLGPGTRTAINKFQARIRDAVTGVLTPGEVQQLVREGNANKNSFEFRQVTDSNVGVSVGIPHKLLTGPVSTKWGKHWDSSRLSIDTLRWLLSLDEQRSPEQLPIDPASDAFKFPVKYGYEDRRLAKYGRANKAFAR
jgi:hypothetical protein